MSRILSQDIIFWFLFLSLILFILMMIFYYISIVIVYFTVSKDIEKKYNKKFEYPKWYNYYKYGVFAKRSLVARFVLLYYLVESKKSSILYKYWNNQLKLINNPLRNFGYKVSYEKKVNIMICIINRLLFWLTIFFMVTMVLGCFLTGMIHT